MSEAVSPAIVIAAFDRSAELSRLCRSIQAADVCAGTPLIISIDGGGSKRAAVRAIADDVSWTDGPLRIIEHEHLGLVEHFARCGDLSVEYGAIVLLEDDLVVGPGFHRWATAALSFSAGDDRIAGISLATPFFDGYRHLPFEPVIDGSDGLYAQIPWYDGMAWTADQWKRYRDAQVDLTTPLHSLLDSLDDDEWFPHAMRYLVATERYYLLPRHSHCTNSGAVGTHFDNATNYFQVPLTMRGPRDYRLLELDDSLAVYDDHLELHPSAVKQLVSELDGYDLTIDLAGMRDLDIATTSHVLTTRPVTQPLKTWGSSMHPLIANLAHDARGDSIRLARRADVDASTAGEAEAAATLKTHASRGRQPSTRDSLGHLRDGIAQRIRRDR